MTFYFVSLGQINENMMRLYAIITAFVICLSTLGAQTDTSGYRFEFVPSGLHFLPLKGNNQEAKVGVLYYPENANLKVDIGNSIDLLKFSKGEGRQVLTFGVDFLAYAYSTSFKGHRLQIDAVDGLFGGNICYSIGAGDNTYFTRLRVIHNSAHFVDGHYDITVKSWINNQEPIPFTRDFGELTFAWQHENKDYSFKIYGGPAYATLVRPLIIKKYSFSAGFEAADINGLGKVFGKDGNLFAAYYFNLAGTPVYTGSHNFLAGIKMGDWPGKGIILYANYYSGTNMFSEYYRERIARTGLGFLVDFY